jgi:hypothetical protein
MDTLVIFRNIPCKVTQEVAGGVQVEAVTGYPFLKLRANPVAWDHTNVTTAAPAELTPFEKTSEIVRLEGELAEMERQQQKLSDNCKSWRLGSGDVLDEYFQYSELVTLKRMELAAAWADATAHPYESHQADDAADERLTGSL